MFFYFPETRRMTLEEIDQVFDGMRHFESDVAIIEIKEGYFGDEKAVILTTSEI